MLIFKDNSLIRRGHGAEDPQCACFPECPECGNEYNPASGHICPTGKRGQIHWGEVISLLPAKTGERQRQMAKANEGAQAPKVEVPTPSAETTSETPASQVIPNTETTETPDVQEPPVVRREVATTTIADENAPIPTSLKSAEATSREGFFQNLRKFNEDNLTTLVGGRITGVVRTEPEEADGDPMYGLQITQDLGQSAPLKLVAWIQVDAEGNGPGFLYIEEER